MIWNPEGDEGPRSRTATGDYGSGAPVDDDRLAPIDYGSLATNSISTCASRGRPATATVERAGRLSPSVAA